MAALIGFVGTLAAAWITVSASRKRKGRAKKFYIVLNLDGLISANASVFLEGKLAGQLAVKHGHHQALATLPLPEADKVQYEIRARVHDVVTDDGGRKFVSDELRTGQGVISPKENETIRLSLVDLVLGGRPVGNTFHAALHQAVVPDLASATRELDEAVLARQHDPDSFEVGLTLYSTMIRHAKLFGSSEAEIRAISDKEGDEGLIAKAVRERWVSEGIAKYCGAGD